VDPDNRRPVDFALRARLLEEALTSTVSAERARGLLDNLHDGRAKLHIIVQLLGLRREQPELFRRGSYLPLGCSGKQAEHVVAFARRHEGRTLVVIGARLFAQLLGEAGKAPLGGDIWTDTRIDAQELGKGARFVNLLTGEPIAVHGGAIGLAQAFAHFPAAALLSDA